MPAKTDPRVEAGCEQCLTQPQQEKRLQGHVRAAALVGSLLLRDDVPPRVQIAKALCRQWRQFGGIDRQHPVHEPNERRRLQSHCEHLGRLQHCVE